MVRFLSFWTGKGKQVIWSEYRSAPRNQLFLYIPGTPFIN